jgi:hypothetical protein
MMQVNTADIRAHIEAKNVEVKMFQQAIKSLLLYINKANNSLDRTHQQGKCNSPMKSSGQSPPHLEQWQEHEIDQNINWVDAVVWTNSMHRGNGQAPSSEALTVLLQMQKQLTDLGQKLVQLDYSSSAPQYQVDLTRANGLREFSDVIAYLVRCIRQLLICIWYIFQTLK